MSYYNFHQKSDLRERSVLIKPKKDTLQDFLTMTTDEVLDKFAALPSAIRCGDGNERWVYIPGKNTKSRVLLVAHADTVFKDKPILYCYKGEVIYSRDKKTGVNADDRAGCTVLWYFRDSGHSLLITDGEESGCKGARALVKDKKWRKIINEHNFALEFDRQDNSDIATYDVGEYKFENFMRENYKTEAVKYTVVRGANTDIAVLFDQIHYDDDEKDKIIPAGNLSIGYRGQHGSEEILVLEDFQRTLSLTRQLLKRDDLPQFYQSKKTYRTNYSNNNNKSWLWERHDAYDITPMTLASHMKNSEATKPKEYKININHYAAIAQDIVKCPSCNFLFDTSEIVVRGSNNECPKCTKSI